MRTVPGAQGCGARTEYSYIPNSDREISHGLPREVMLSSQSNTTCATIVSTPSAFTTNKLSSGHATVGDAWKSKSPLMGSFLYTHSMIETNAFLMYNPVSKEWITSREWKCRLACLYSSSAVAKMMLARGVNP